MDFANSVLEAFQAHPWGMSCGLVILAAGLIGLLLRLQGLLRRRKGRALRLRTQDEQKRFQPVETVYAPRQFRKKR